MKMTKDDYRRFICIVAGENPAKQMEPYDSKKEVEDYLVYKFEDAEKIRENYIKMLEATYAENDGISPSYAAEIKNLIEETKALPIEDFYYNITENYTLDAETGDAYSNKNKDGKWEFFENNSQMGIPFVLKDGTNAVSAKKGDIDWTKMHRHGIETYTSVWETVMEGRKPENEHEEQLYNNMKNKKAYLGKFETKENYVASCTAFWGFAFLSEETGWLELEPNVEQFEWMNGFYDRFIAPLPDDTLLTTYNCHR